MERERETAPPLFWVVPVRRSIEDRQTGRCKL